MPRSVSLSLAYLRNWYYQQGPIRRCVIRIKENHTMNIWRKRLKLGFIEIFVVSIVIVVFAGLAVPIMSQMNVGPRIGTDKTELQTVQSAVDAMMWDQGISSLPDPGPSMSGSLRSTTCSSTSDMSVFPYTGPGVLALLGGSMGNYVEGNTVERYYVDASGEVHPDTGDCE